MSHEPTPYTHELQRYAIERSEPDPVLEELAAETDDLEEGRYSSMRMAAEQAALMTVLVRSIEAKRALEIGTFTGYGAVAIARGLPAEGKLITCEISEQFSVLAARYWHRLGVADRIDQRIAPALETLAELGGESFDFAFIDADKENYLEYYEECMRLVRPGGMIAVDNVFWKGEVATDRSDPDLDAIRRLNDRVAADERLTARSMISVADGIFLAVK